MNIPQNLKNALSTGKVIPFAGAGVSMAVLDNQTGQRLFPSWKQLLEKAAERLEGELKPSDAQLVRSFLAVSPAQYLQAAEWAQRGLGAGLYEIIGQEIDVPHERVAPESLRLAQALWNLGSKLVVTTNYDRVLRWACPQSLDLSDWNIQATAEQAELLRQGAYKHTIWHLHGIVNDKANLILTPDGFKRLYNPEKRESETNYQAALTTLRTLVASHTFLFVGFSLEDEVGAQLKSVSDIFQGTNGPHYVLVREAESERIKSLNLPVEIITFAEHGAPLLELLQEMAAFAVPNTQKEPDKAPKTVIPASFDPRNPPFNVPYRSKGDQVVGRGSELEAVRRQLTQGHCTAIGQTASFQGLGGLGKTQLAVEYAWKYRDDYPNGVIWLNADQDMDAQLIALSEKARWVAPESDHKNKLDVALHRLKSYSECLLVFDNLELQDAIRDYLPEPQANPHILVTSRDDQLGFTPVPLTLLDADLALQLLIQEAGREPNGEVEYQAARDIVTDLDGLPLALELAGAYLRHRPVSWAQYRDLRRQRMQDAILPNHPTFTRHDTDIYSTLRVSEGLLDEEPRLREILDLLTWSGSAPMGLSLLSALLEVENPVALTGALGLGEALRLLRLSPDSNSYAIHRLLGEVRRVERPLDEQSDWVNSICTRIGDWFQDRRRDFADLALFEAEIDHLRAWQEQAVQLSPRHASRLIWLQAYPPFYWGRYKESQRWVRQAMAALERESSPNQELQAHLLNDLGATAGQLGGYAKALDNHERALAIRREVLGENHPDTATSLNNVGGAYGDLGNYQKQLEYIEQGLVIWREVLGEKLPDTARSLNNAGAAYGALGKHQKQLEYCEQALAIRREVLGELHPNTASSLINVGGAYGALGNHQKRLEYQEQALAILREVLGEKHPDTARSLNNVGLAYDDLGDFSQAINHAKRAVEVAAEALGSRHPATLLYIHNLATVLNNSGQRWPAFQLLDKTLRDLPRDNLRFEELAQLARNLLNGKPLRSGFRQPSVKEAERNWGKAK